MQNYLPAPAQQPEALALTRELPIEVLPTSYAEYAQPLAVQRTMPGYSTVHVHVREQSYVASNDPHFVAGCAECARMSAMSTAAAATTGGNAVNGTNKKHRRGNNVPAWICVGQLAAIIWLIGTQKLHVDVSDVVNVIKEKSVATTAQVGSFFFSGGGLPILSNGSIWQTQQAQAIDIGKPSNGKRVTRGKHAQTAHAGATKSGASAKSSFSWPTCKLLIPPPPPTAVSFGRDGAKIPPPPNGFPSILAAGPGAVAASTLPPGAAERESVMPSSVNAKSVPADTSDGELHKSEHKQHAASPFGSDDESARVVRPVYERPSLDAKEAPPFFELDGSSDRSQNSAAAPPTAPGTIDSAMPPEQLHSPPAMRAVSQPSSAPSRTVMAGKRKRTLVDR